MKLVHTICSLVISTVLLVSTSQAVPVRNAAAAIPVVSQLISMCEAIAGNPDAARQTQEYFSRTYTALPRYCVEAAMGNHDEAKETMRTLKHCCTFGQSVNTYQLIRAASLGHFDEVKHQVEFGADVNARDKDGMPVLHYAVFSHNVEIIKYLLEKGADMNAVIPSNNQNVFDFALNHGTMEILGYLVDRGSVVTEAQLECFGFQMTKYGEVDNATIRKFLREVYNRQNGIDEEEQVDTHEREY